MDEHGARDITFTLKVPDNSFGMQHFNLYLNKAGVHELECNFARDQLPDVCGFTELEPETEYEVTVEFCAGETGPCSAELSEGTIWTKPLSKISSIYFVY